MQPEYKWQKGKDAWEESEASRPQLPTLPPRRRWSIVLAVVLIMSLIGASVFWILNRRASANTAAVEEDILRTNSLIFQAVNAGDLELLRSNLSGRDQRWQSAIESAALDGLFFDRPFWGFHLQPSSLDGSEIDIELNPEWNSAELSLPLDYTYESVDGVTTTVRLERTLLYRRSREQWLLAPPGVDFWGGRLLYEGQFVTLNYPARDREIVEQLAADLDVMVGEICKRVEGADCPADFRVPIRLNTNAPNLTSVVSENKAPPCSLTERGLPSPTLIGVPTDEAGYGALLQGYRSEVANVALVRLIYEPACPSNPMAFTTLDYRMNLMGYRPWPLTTSDYTSLADEIVHLEQVEYYLQNWIYYSHNEDRLVDWRPFYALVEFLAAGDESTLKEIEADIIENPSIFADYWATLQNWTGGRYGTDRGIELAWRQFLADKGEVDDAKIADLPEQNLRLVCRRPGEFVVIATLYELDPAEERWRIYYTLDHSNGYLVGLPGDGGVVVAEQRLDTVATNTPILLWQEDEPVVLFDTATNLLPVSVSEIPGRGEQLLVYIRRDRLYGIVSPTECQAAASCDLLPLPGFPIWSPSGERFLLVIPIGTHGYEKQYDRPFTLGQMSTIMEPLSGKSQFWLSDERFGFVTEDGRTVMAIMLDEDDQLEETEVLLTLEEIDPFLALDEAVTIESVLSVPDESQVLIVTVKDSEGWASVYRVNILLRRVQLLMEHAFSLNTEAVYSYDFSPEGRWLMVSGNDLTTSTAHLHLFDLGGQDVHSYEYKMEFSRPMHWTIDWSAGDEWLAVPDNGYIRLINPAADYQNVVVPEGMSCTGAVWVDRE